MTEPKIFSMTFKKIYLLYLNKIERKNREKQELDEVIYWLTGYNKDSLNQQLTKEVTVAKFFDEAPAFNVNSSLIKGVVCGVRVEDVEDPMMQKIRYLDKLVDELAKGKALEKVLR